MKYLRRGGVFRIIASDLEYYINRYKASLTSHSHDQRESAAIEFCKGTCFGTEGSRATLPQRLNDAFANSGHRWMWDCFSLTKALSNHGFINIKRFQRGDCADEMFLRPGRPHQFGVSEVYGLALECTKPI